MEHVISELDRIKDKPVIVEGHNDRECLERLGFTDVNVLNGPIYSMIEDLQHEEEVVILTDLDSAGKRLYGRLSKGFAKFGVRVDNKIRKLLFRTKLRQIEGLFNYLQRELLRP